MNLSRKWGVFCIIYCGNDVPNCGNTSRAFIAAIVATDGFYEQGRVSKRDGTSEVFPKVN
jgi:hypothetical protein